jgi:predicted GTPase
MAFRCIIMGAAGRDFHDFQTFFRGNPAFRVVAFTATQIPFIDRRAFPRELAGPLYDADVPIFPEEDLPRLLRDLDVDFVFLAYSDLSHEEVMHRASLVQAAGAGFGLLGPRQTQLVSRRPVVSVTAVRTGAGKSPVTLAIAGHLRSCGVRTSILRHPMPYGDLRRQTVQRFAAESDLARAECTIEEREEYEPYLEAGLVVYAGVDYRAILAAAEEEADAVLWDGGNNDYPFLRPDLSIVVADALRPGHEVSYYPGETNLRAADVVVVSKVSAAEPAAVALVKRHAAELAPRAAVVEADLAVAVDDPGAIAGRRVLVVEDGPTLTHGGMPSGAGLVAARLHGAREVVDPRLFATGTVAEAYARYPHIGPVLPALGYSASQRRELEENIVRSHVDLVIDASPSRLDRFLALPVPVVRVQYRFEQRSGPPLLDLVVRAVASGRRPS